MAKNLKVRVVSKLLSDEDMYNIIRGDITPQEATEITTYKLQDLHRLFPTVIVNDLYWFLCNVGEQNNRQYIPAKYSQDNLEKLYDYWATQILHYNSVAELRDGENKYQKLLAKQNKVLLQVDWITLSNGEHYIRQKYNCDNGYRIMISAHTCNRFADYMIGEKYTEADIIDGVNRWCNLHNLHPYTHSNTRKQDKMEQILYERYQRYSKMVKSKP